MLHALKVGFWFGICLLFSSLSSAQTVKLATGEWAPFQSATLKNDGYVSQIIVEAFAEEGYDVELIYMPWKRAMEEAKQGRVDGTFLWGKSEERSKHFSYTAPVVTLTNVLFQRTDNPITWNKPEELKAYKIGGIDGFSYGIEKWEEQGFIKLERIFVAENNYKKLALGRLDFVIEDRDVGMAIIHRIGLQGKITENNQPVNNRSYYILMPTDSPRTKQLINTFNRGFSKVVEDGRYEAYREASIRGEYKLK
ncbi:substrate-binding periplasmic protein [Vibrio marisflavi]|uniref:Solute-binding protein family 3/N-terminal domain-containing protein n=1 Tax=Vibrio marisflavi CECT 7928 TaxID=634439 RepID=A0ABN8DZL3_9VIBR|nr:transporter substrate-binding domain-containing protein [Vibrio marisflavi]CAH0535981.1 hypothetical protein VMF7928_00082 [Vibrio marisflavi CECT 7928]